MHSSLLPHLSQLEPRCSVTCRLWGVVLWLLAGAYARCEPALQTPPRHKYRGATAQVVYLLTPNVCALLHMYPADQHLESSTKRTLVENETMVAELAYHTAQVGACTSSSAQMGVLVYSVGCTRPVR